MQQILKDLAVITKNGKLEGVSGLGERIAMELGIFTRKPYEGRALNFYSLSSGRCGTKFLYRVLSLATNATVFHSPTPHLRYEVQKLVQIYKNDFEKFRRLNTSSFRRVQLMLRHQSTYTSEVYGNTMFTSYALGLLLYKHFGNERIRLLHLIRNPIDCCSSILRAEREDGGVGFRFLRGAEFIEGKSDAEKAASIWINTNQMISDIFREINNPQICQVVRIEDVDLEKIKELYKFLHLKGFDEARILPLMSDASEDVRHSHQGRLDQEGAKRITNEEIEIIKNKTRDFAKRFGYQV